MATRSTTEVTALSGLSLCSGIGGIDLGLRLALGDRYRTVCHVEREAFAAAVLVARMEEQALDPAPCWDCLSTFDGTVWRGCVDLVTAGLPCQPYSTAGTRLGNEDERAIWPHFVRIVEEVEPAAVFIENVPRFLKYTGPLCNGLAQLGFQWAPPLLHTASELGAPHIRKRLFLFASHPDRPVVWDEPGRAEASGQATAELGDAGAPLASHAGRTGLEERPGERTAAKRSGPPAPDADSTRLASEWSGWIFDVERQTFRHDPDRCSVLGCRICGSPWEAESPVCRVDDELPGRVDQLRCLGNAVVPQVVESAFSILTGQQA